ncbi:hypothetical protein AXG93_2016s1040 [Marchantia polymorpha subsp. ruderalis]|uniref:Uncharacterized protein n=1 Tax=Marchantia polymorpha subsp. ruderalis TaxID=1480154 RepID=A0A176VV67_MARPO|nr:hypothetical protein AXG93_2016s1040 [Marchantia polymorpha subsp. ruderalis]
MGVSGIERLRGMSCLTAQSATGRIGLTCDDLRRDACAAALAASSAWVFNSQWYEPRCKGSPDGSNGRFLLFLSCAFLAWRQSAACDVDENQKTMNPGKG